MKPLERTDIISALVEKHGRVVHLLQDWARWQSKFPGVAGYGSKSVGICSGYVSKTFDDLIEESDEYVCKAVEAAVDDLSAYGRSAINKCYGVAKFFPFNGVNYEDVLDMAHAKVRSGLIRRGIVVEW